MKATLDSRAICVLALTLVFIPAFAANTEAPGVPNFHQVSDRVYRSAQPTDEGWKSLAKIGVKTIVDLRCQNEHSAEAEAQKVEAAGMRYVNIPWRGRVAPSDEDISKALALMNSSAAGPVLVHCKRGADRTGTLIAVYRIIHDHWQNDRALKEAESCGMGWTQFGLKRYISKFQAPAEVAAAGTNPEPAALHP